jgi:anti-sigma regulatory factor (Ser/Thr protein kinase)
VRDLDSEDAGLNPSTQWEGPKGAGIDLRAAIDLPAVPESLSAARRFVASMLDEWSFVDPEQVVALLTSELVSNVVRHAGGNIGLEMEILGKEALRVQARDDYPDSAVVQRSEFRGAGGRGLSIVDSLARRWGVDKYENYKVVWFETSIIPRSGLAPLPKRPD